MGSACKRFRVDKGWVVCWFKVGLERFRVGLGRALGWFGLGFTRAEGEKAGSRVPEQLEEQV